MTGDSSSENSEVLVFRELASCFSIDPNSDDSALYLDFSILAASTQDWETAHELLQKMSPRNESEEEQLKLWTIKCLVELEKYSDAVSLANIRHWQPQSRVHINFLLGVCYKELGLQARAERFFDAVKKSTKHYPGFINHLRKE